MNSEEEYKIVYNFANDFLLDLVKKRKMEKGDLDEKILKEHLKPETAKTLSELNERLIISLQNRQHLPKVINFNSEENKPKFKNLLFNYDPKEILNHYSTHEDLFEIFKKNFVVKNSDSKNNSWYQFAKGILSGAKFFSTFNEKKDFDEFVKSFSSNKTTLNALPLLLESKINGFGFALACDFLKEIGYVEFAKPDTHLIEIFSELKLSQSKDPQDVYESIIKMSEITQENAYKIDKIFWLISTGEFYKNKINIGRNKDNFIEKAKLKLTETNKVSKL
jgi:thermostable 8-oxoguanine DNA glycosylase